MEQFKSFITEEKNSDYRIVVLSVEHGDKSITSKRIKAEADELIMFVLFIQQMMKKVLKFMSRTLLFLFGAHQKEIVGLTSYHN